MSWLGLRHKGTEPLYSDEWNKVVDGLDILYGYVSSLNAQLDCIEAKIDQYYLEIKKELAELKQPESVETYSKSIGATPVPLSDVDKTVKRIHVKVPSWALYIVYLGDATAQDFVLEGGDEIDMEVKNPRSVYVRSLGNVTIYVMLEA